ncbi:MAG TPA: PRC-barrel domain-containing protein [Hyphomicrobiaceae bacterium]|nr:PRC-barrel domain-containing protein [Hyphomicrobiaceae bacterium]
MRQVFYAGLVALLLAPVAMDTRAQTAGEIRLGVTVIERDDIVNGWSVKRQLLGQDVYNDKDEKIGKIEDIIIGRNRASSYGIVSAGGFLGIGAHDVAIPAGQFQMKNDRILLPGATKEQIRAMAPFEYTRK